ncbi:hypothetical protein CDT94_20460 [Cronobacter sakazakii]|nr:hypothetical protein CDU02_20775 [Cronobacter sakazakii]PUV50698.1 hypothetical protein CDT94_20460 [Cronobacter sakazakii]
MFVPTWWAAAIEAADALIITVAKIVRTIRFLFTIILLNKAIYLKQFTLVDTDNKSAKLFLFVIKFFVKH